MQEKTEVPEEYREQPQRKMRDVWKQKYFMVHLCIIVWAASLLSPLEEGSCAGQAAGEEAQGQGEPRLCPHTPGAALHAHCSTLRQPCQVSSTATASTAATPTCWGARSEDKASSLKQPTQPETQTPQTQQQQDSPRKGAHIIPCASPQLFNHGGVQVRCGRHHTSGCCSHTHRAQPVLQGCAPKLTQTLLPLPGDVVDHESSCCSSVVASCDSPESLLSCCIPNL